MEEVQPQHMAALAKANQTRLKRADIKKKLKTGQLSIVDLLKNPPQEIENATLFELLMSIRRWGRLRTLTLLASLPISEDKKIGTLTDRQKKQLIRLLK